MECIDKMENMTFETFIVTDANRNEYNICKQILDNVDTYRLVFFQLPSHDRLHLKHAFETWPQNRDKLHSITAKDFSTSLIEKIKAGKNTTKMTKCEDADILLIDDLQHIIGKDTTQEEFYFLLRHRLENKKVTLLFSESSAQHFSGELANLLKLGLHRAE